MAIINIKGHEIQSVHIRDSYDRRALQTMNNILKLLESIGIEEDDININMESVAMKKAPASVSWYVGDYHLHYSYSASSKFVENLIIVYKVLELEVTALIEGKKTIEDFILEFKEEHDVTEQRENARTMLGLDKGVIDMDIIDKKYKELAKEHHPDKETGSVEKFKEINRAHKTLKRELL